MQGGAHVLRISRRLTLRVERDGFIAYSRLVLAYSPVKCCFALFGRNYALNTYSHFAGLG